VKSAELVPANEHDFESMFALHCLVFREHIVQLWGWDETWQRENFRTEFSSSFCSVILHSGAPVGYLQTAEHSGRIRLWNIAIQPTFQGRGIGRSVVNTVQQIAAQRSLPLTLRVFPTNPRAQRFYERQGFREISRTRTGIEMEWRAA
jgi:ribosomal protein S18 acetylase RimI-like enzyme